MKQHPFLSELRWSVLSLCRSLVLSLWFVSFIPLTGSQVIDFPEMVDEARERKVPMTFHLPAEKEAMPLVLISHGGGGNRHGMYALSAELAQQGYVVLCLEHVTSNTDNIRLRMKSQGLGFGDALRDCGKDKVARENRPLDVRFAIDLAEEFNQRDERFKGRIDFEQIAMVGHSYGAYTTMVCCGAKPRGIEKELSEPRIKLGIAFSPQGTDGVFFDEKSFAHVQVPFVGVSGTGDIQGDGHREFFKLMPPGDKHLLWFHDANHFSFSDSSGSPRRFHLRKDKDVTRSLKVIVPRILDHYLKNQGELNEKERGHLVTESLGGKVKKIEWIRN